MVSGVMGGVPIMRALLITEVDLSSLIVLIFKKYY